MEIRRFSDLNKLINKLDKCCDIIYIKDGVIFQKMSNSTGIISVDLLKNGILDDKISMILDNPKTFNNRAKIFESSEFVNIYKNENKLITIEDNNTHVSLYTGDENLNKYQEISIDEEDFKVYDLFFNGNVNVDLDVNGEIYERIRHLIKFYENPELEFKFNEDGECEIILQTTSTSRDNSSKEQAVIKNIPVKNNNKSESLSCIFNGSFTQLPISDVNLKIYHVIEESTSLLHIGCLLEGIPLDIYQVGVLRV